MLEESETESEGEPLLPTDEPFLAIRGKPGKRHTGFAFSGEAGHAPQITNPHFMKEE
jgi:hypothetical protein